MDRILILTPRYSALNQFHNYILLYLDRAVGFQLQPRLRILTQGISVVNTALKCDLGNDTRRMMASKSNLYHESCSLTF